MLSLLASKTYSDFPRERKDSFASTVQLCKLKVVVVGGSRAGHLRKFLEARAFMRGATLEVPHPLCALDFAERFKEQEIRP